MRHRNFVDSCASHIQRMCVLVFEYSWAYRRLRRAMKSRPVATQPQSNFLGQISPLPVTRRLLHAACSLHRPLRMQEPALLSLAPFVPPFDAMTRASQVASFIQSSECSMTTMTRNGRTTIQSVSSALDRCACGFANASVGSCPYTSRTSNRTICYTSSSHTVIGETGKSARCSLELV